MKLNEQPQLVYLTNSSGEATGYGTIELNDELLNKLSFEDGPGEISTYIGEIDGRAYALGVLPLDYQAAEVQGRESEIKEFRRAGARIVGNEVRIHLNGMFEPQDFHVLVEEGSGCFVVIAAIALDKLRDCMHTRQAFRVAFGETRKAAASEVAEIEQQLPERLFLVANGSNGAAPNGCEVVLDDVDGGNEERDYFLISVVHGDPEVLARMARRVRSSWQICNGIDTDRLDAMALRGEAFVKESEKHQERIEQLQQLAAQAIAAASDLSNGYPERELSVPLDQLKAAAAELGVSLDS